MKPLIAVALCATLFYLGFTAGVDHQIRQSSSFTISIKPLELTPQTTGLVSKSERWLSFWQESAPDTSGKTTKEWAVELHDDGRVIIERDGNRVLYPPGVPVPKGVREWIQRRYLSTRCTYDPLRNGPPRRKDGSQGQHTLCGWEDM